MSGYARVGQEFVVNSTYARSQAQPDSSRLANGNFVISWVDADFNTTAGRYVRAQIFQPDGTPVDSELTLFVSGNGGVYPSLAGLADGGFVAFNTSLLGISGRVFDATGSAVGAEFTVTTTAASNVDSVALANGGFAVVWHDSRTTGGDASGSGVHVSTYDANGVAVASGVVNTTTSGNQADASVAALAGGSYIVTWTDRGTASWVVKGQIFDASGAKSGGEIAITSSGAAVESAVTLLANGNFAVAWYEGGTHHVQAYAAAGTAIGGQVQVPASLSGIQTGPQLAALGNGGFVLTWVGNQGAQYDGSGAGVYFQAFDANAQAVGSPELVNTLLAGDQVQPTVTALDDAGFVISWTDLSVAGADNNQVRAQIFTLDHAPPSGELRIVSGGGGDLGTALSVEFDSAIAFVRAEAPPSSTVQYAITGGADAGLFTIDAASGLLRFVGVPDFEAPADADADNLYQVVVTASDGTVSDSQALTVQLLDMNDAPTITSPMSFTVNENGTAVGSVTAVDNEGDAISYTVVGGAEALAYSSDLSYYYDSSKFYINPTSGAITFTSAPNFEAPADYGNDGVYRILVRATDSNGSGSALQAVTIIVANVNEGTTITSNGGGSTAALSHTENQTYATTVVARDNAGPSLTFSIAGGSDAAKFTINAQTGVLSFATAPNYEAPNDFGLNRVYDVTVAASDGVLTDTQALAITLTNVNEAPVITSNGGGETAAITVNENTIVSVTSVFATDPESNPRTYAIVGGADAARFAINASTGSLSFVSAPNFEAPSDVGANNVYDVIVQASDGSLADTQALAITVTNVNEAPVIGTAASFSVPENGLLAATIAASDPDGQTLTYSIAGGLDAARFTINAQTGALNFVSAPNFESPVDNGSNNVYNVTVGARDGAITTTKALTITVTNVNEAPAITSNGGGDTAVVSVAENGAAVTIVTSTDPEGAARTYAIAGGADGARFAINAATGALTFVAAPDFEAPTDADGDNVYQVIVQTSDGALTDTQALSVTVSNVNEAPTIISASAISVAENSALAALVASTDPEGTLPSYAIVGGADAVRFAIDAESGALSFVAAPDHEAPADADGDNVYQVAVRADDGALSDSKALTITVTNVNEAPAITSDGGGAAATIALAENGTAVTVVGATDPENNSRSYAIVGGDDAARFTIDAASGVLSFVSAPDFEAPGDADGDNAYAVVVSASDGALADTQALSVVVENGNEGPTFASAATLAASENTLAAGAIHASDPEGDALAYAIAAGADAAKFTIDSATGALSFVSAPDFEAPADADGNNAYEVVVSADDGSLTALHTVAVSVTNVNEAALFASAQTFSASENAVTPGVVHAADPEAQVLAYAIAGGADAARFAIDAVTGELTFVSAPDYETPADADGDNAYLLVVSASDGSLAVSQTLTVVVGNADEAPVIASGELSALENGLLAGSVAAADPDGAALDYAIVGGNDAACFTIDPISGALSFVAAPNSESPGDTDGNNVYELAIRVSDGTLATVQAVTVTVGDVDEAPVISSQTVYTVAENATAVSAIAGSDPEGAVVTYAIGGGADAASFAIDAATGALSFLAPPNFEAPGDADGDNAYEVVVSASDGSLSNSHALSITVANVDEAPVITSNGGGDTAAVTVSENTTGVTTLAATDPEGTARTYAIAGGADAARFTVNASTGALSFLAAPNHEAPTDSNSDNVYNVVVSASDGTLSDSQAIAVTVANLNEAPVIISNGGGDTAALIVNENNIAVDTVASTDPEGAARTYAISGGADAAKFAINANTGALSFHNSPNYEAPTDSNGDNIYQVAVSASDGSLSDLQALSITVGNLVDGLALTGTTKADTLTGSVAEDTITGLAGADTLNGAGGADTINGGDGNDTLIGGAGADRLIGGLGSDTFVFQAPGDSTPALADFLTDFSTAQGDKISLSAIDANAHLAGNQAFTWIATAAFAGAAGQLRYVQSSGDTWVSGDVNGDALADFMIQIDPLVTLAANSFIL